MKKSALLSVFIGIILTIFSQPLFATFYRGANITYREVGTSSLEYEITITTYTKTSSCGAHCRPTLDSVHMGDGNVMQFIRNSEVFLPNDITENKYVETYTYPGSGTYIIYFFDPERFSVSSSNCTYAILIIPHICPSSPMAFGEIPIFFGQQNKTYVHNVAAIDAGHDSLSFQIVSCLMDSTYMFPTGISINAISGQINWPVNSSPIGDYAFAVLINEWRGGIWNGSFEIAYTVAVNTGADTLYYFTPPNLAVDSTRDYYKIVNPGDTVSFKIKYFDNDSAATVTAYSEALLTSDAPNIQIINFGNTDSATVTWIPDATHSRAYPWTFVFRGTSGVRQLDLTVLIYVNGTQHDTCYALNNITELNNKNADLKIYPNPFEDQLTVAAKGNEEFEITLFDITSRKLLHRYFVNSTSINAEHLARGVYFYEVRDKNDAVKRGKLVKG